eukprot:1860559-Pyramimonas_sp.AAC.1
MLPVAEVAEHVGLCVEHRSQHRQRVLRPPSHADIARSVRCSAAQRNTAQRSALHNIPCNGAYNGTM